MKATFRMDVYFLVENMRVHSVYIYGSLIAERLSARQLILRRISAIVRMYICMCMYVSRLGMQSVTLIPVLGKLFYS